MSEKRGVAYIWPILALRELCSVFREFVCPCCSRCGVVKTSRSEGRDGKGAEPAKEAQACRLWDWVSLQVNSPVFHRKSRRFSRDSGAEESEEALEAELLALHGKSPVAGKGKKGSGKGSKVMSLNEIDSMVAGLDNVGEVRKCSSALRQTFKAVCEFVFKF